MLMVAIEYKNNPNNCFNLTIPVVMVKQILGGRSALALGGFLYGYINH
jgi:hypothetical protein